ncbi:MAG: DUF58 domain-containing protein [Candidatus Promineifilaceae bacterium]
MQPETKLKSNARTPMIGVAVLAILALLLPHRTWTVMLATLSVLIGLSYYWMRTLSDAIEISRSVNSRWVAVGDFLSETFTLTNHSNVPLLWAEVVDQSNVPGYRAASVRAAGPHQMVRWREQAVCERRGRFQLGPWLLRTSDPFGLFELTIRYDAVQEIVIHPPVHVDLPVVLPSGSGSGELRSLRRREQALVNVSSVREYRPNDPLKHIHWRSSAKRGNLLVRQFDEDSGGDVWILVDLNRAVQVGQGIDGTEEQAVLLAASLAARALAVNRPVGLVAYGDEPQILAPNHGEGQRWQILRSLALVSAENSHTPLVQALADVQRLAKRGAALLIISADNSAEWLPNLFRLTQIGVNVYPVLFNSASFSAADDPDNAAHATQQELTRLHINCTLLQKGEIGRQSADTVPSNRKVVYTPLGRAIIQDQR